jgi:hypothetical protein
VTGTERRQLLDREGVLGGAVALVQGEELLLEGLARHPAVGDEPLEHRSERGLPHPEPVEEGVVHVRDQDRHGGTGGRGDHQS